MNLWHIGRQNLTRTARIIMILASLAAVTAQGAGANQSDDAYTNSITQIQVCKAMGGHPEITTIMNGAGKYVVEVICHGGYMDGFACINIIGETWCRWEVMEFRPKESQRDPEVIAPLDEPATATIDVVLPDSPPGTEDPAISESTATPVPDPTATPDDAVSTEPIVDPGNVDVAPIDPPKDEPTVDAGNVDVAPIDAPKGEQGVDDSDGRPVVPEMPVEIDDLAPIETEEPFLL